MLVFVEMACPSSEMRSELEKPKRNADPEGDEPSQGQRPAPGRNAAGQAPGQLDVDGADRGDGHLGEQLRRPEQGGQAQLPLDRAAALLTQEGGQDQGPTSLGVGHVQALELGDGQDVGDGGGHKDRGLPHRQGHGRARAHHGQGRRGPHRAGGQARLVTEAVTGQDDELTDIGVGTVPAHAGYTLLDP